MTRSLFPFVHRRRYEALERNWQEVLKINQDIYNLLVEHHAVGRVGKIRVGERCPICVEAGVSRLDDMTGRWK